MLEYQKIDSELVKIERELNNSTEKEKASALNAKIKTAGDNMAKFQSEADELNLNAEKLAANVGKYESEVKEIADSISDVQDEQEIEYYEKVLAGLSEDVNKLLRELQRVSARIDQVKDNSDNLTRQAVQLNEQYKVALQSYQNLKLKLQNEGTRLHWEILCCNSSCSLQLFIVDPIVRQIFYTQFHDAMKYAEL